MRGKVRAARVTRIKIRITPAYAGKSRSTRTAATSGRDHPRLCGEKVLRCILRSLGLGSPPPMRGKGMSNSHKLSMLGITPAYAGKSDVNESIRTAKAGSPPPMRGKVSELAIVDSVLVDHPRLCGEKVRSLRPHQTLAGSPPPMRGKGHTVGLTASVIGITPAYAGKSSNAFAVDWDGKDHPRLCGEKFWLTTLCTKMSGSPPPMRGKAVSVNNTQNTQRITPAYAGKRT